MSRDERDEWPDLLFLLGDQVYVDEGSPRRASQIRARRDTERAAGRGGPRLRGVHLALPRESWRDPLIRWLFSTVSISMVWDDHDMSDDWNISRSWLEEMQRQAPGGTSARSAASSSYWIYQHIGNLSPRELDENEVYARCAAASDATERAARVGEEIDVDRRRDALELLPRLRRGPGDFMDSARRRVLTGERRSMVDDEEWDWLVDHCKRRLRPPADRRPRSPTCSRPASIASRPGTSGSATAPGAAPSPAAARSCAGPSTSTTGPRSSSPSRGSASCSKRSAPAGGARPPASIAILSGDVHHAYLCEVAFRPEARVESPSVQAVCSPYRNPLYGHERRVVRAGFSRPFTAVAAASPGRRAPDPGLGWRLLEGPYFDNQVATIRLDGREATCGSTRPCAGSRTRRRSRRASSAPSPEEAAVLCPDPGAGAPFK